MFWKMRIVRNCRRGLVFFVGFCPVEEDKLEIVRYVKKRFGKPGKEITAWVEFVVEIFNNLFSHGIVKIDEDITAEDDILRGKKAEMAFISQVGKRVLDKVFDRVFDLEITVL